MINTVEKNYFENVFVSYKVTYSDSTISFVPLDPDNTDYQEIQDWVADGNTITDPNAE